MVVLFRCRGVSQTEAESCSSVILKYEIKLKKEQTVVTSVVYTQYTLEVEQEERGSREKHRNCANRYS
jgi:predicted CopG family antitoxin